VHECKSAGQVLRGYECAFTLFLIFEADVLPEVYKNKMPGSEYHRAFSL